MGIEAWPGHDRSKPKLGPSSWAGLTWAWIRASQGPRKEGLAWTQLVSRANGDLVKTRGVMPLDVKPIYP